MLHRGFVARISDNEVSELCPEQDRIAVVIEESSLSLAKRSNIDRRPCLNPHFLQGLSMRYRRYNQPAFVFETDKSPIEQVIYRRRQQQSILAVQAFFIA
jgi:hypothetical protein